MLHYSIKKIIDIMGEANDALQRKINESDIGLFNIVKGIISEGDGFDLENLIDLDNNFLEDIAGNHKEDLDQLNGFLFDLGYQHECSTQDHLDDVMSKVDSVMESIGDKLDNYFVEIEDAFERGSIWNKICAATKVAKIAINLKGFFVNIINEMFNPLIDELYRELVKAKEL